MLVHLGEESQAAEWFAGTELAGLPRHADPEKRLYRAFGLGRGGLRALASWKVFRRGFQAGVRGGHGVGKVQADPRQMPGVFLVHGEQVLADFVHETAADRPDYVELARTAVEVGTA